MERKWLELIEVAGKIVGLIGGTEVVGTGSEVAGKVKSVMKSKTCWGVTWGCLN